MSEFNRFSLKIEHENYAVDLIDEFRKSSTGADACLDKHGNTDNELTWNRHKLDLIKFSKKPICKDVLFILHVQLQNIDLDKDDDKCYGLYKFYVKNGEYFESHARIEYEPFNESIL